MKRFFFVYTEKLAGCILRLCRRKRIENLHFHGLQPKATSGLFEKGLYPVEARTITGRKDTKFLMRYEHLRLEDFAERLG